MRDLDEFAELIEYGGDTLLSAVIIAAHSRRKAIEIITRASENYLESRKKLKSINEKYAFLLKCCAKLLKTNLGSSENDEHLTDEEKEAIISAARIYISSGGKAKKRKGTIIFSLIFVLVIAALLIYGIHYVYSDDYGERFSQWYEREEEFREENGWGH